MFLCAQGNYKLLFYPENADFCLFLDIKSSYNRVRHNKLFYKIVKHDAHILQFFCDTGMRLNVCLSTEVLLVPQDLQ